MDSSDRIEQEIQAAKDSIREYVARARATTSTSTKVYYGELINQNRELIEMLEKDAFNV